MFRAKRVLEHLRNAALAYVVLVLALILTFLAHDYVRETVKESRSDRFDEEVLATQEALERRKESYEGAMRGARGLFYARGSVAEEEWSSYASGIDLEDRYEGMQVLGYAKRVRPAERSAFENELSQTFREEGRPDPALRPGGERPAYFPMTYVEPLDEVNRGLLGYDYYSDPAHHIAMSQARDTGEPRSTGKVYLLSEASPGSRADFALKEGFVVYLPIYYEGAAIGTAVERRGALEGFIVGAFKAEDFMQEVFDEREPLMDFEVYEGEGPTQKNLIYDDDEVKRADEIREPPGFFETSREYVGLPVSRPGGAPELSASKLSASKQLDLAGQRWVLYFEALPGFEEGGESQLPIFVLLSGLAMSILLFGITYMLVRSRLRTERAKMALEHTNHELEATNRELEAFSYSVSHDLRAPLRSIDGFSQILLEDYADELDEDGKDYLSRVRAASQRMGRLIDDLLGLSRVTRGTMNRERVNLSDLAEEVAEGLREANSERVVEFSAQKGLKAWGDPRLLRVALANLIGNAWKFTEKEPEARIEFGVDEELSRRGRIPVYYVRDNGAGFDMSYADKLFGAFQRLHGADEFEGTGIGLATVQRVVRRHGGRIWAEGAVGRGATFYFTLRPGLGFDPAAAKPHKEGVEAK